jgi:hypothetical protein
MAGGMSYEQNINSGLAAFDKALMKVPGYRRAVLENVGVVTEVEIHKVIPHGKTGLLESKVYHEVVSDRECHVGVRGVKYAAKVHEVMTRRDGSPIHYTKPGSGHHYVSLPMRKIAKEYFAKIAAQLNQQVWK